MLAQLTEVGNVTKEMFERRFREFEQQGDTYFVVVCEDLRKNQLAGCATLVIEKKIIHDCGSVRRSTPCRSVWTDFTCVFVSSPTYLSAVTSKML